MDLQLRADPGIKLDSSENYTSYKIIGAEVGEYPVYFAAKANRFSMDATEIISNYVTIDVFPPLQIIPPEVLLMPGSLFTLDYTGGPTRSKYKHYSIDIKWSIRDSGIALIDQKALLNA
jgi:hypothetical protein